MTKRSGFTLAEVLITLGIIGVVAAMTIPTLIANTNGAKFRSQFKKSLSTLNQAGLMAQAQYDFDYAGATETCSGTDAASYSTENPEGKMSFCAIFNGTLTGQTALGTVSSIKVKSANSSGTTSEASYSLKTKSVLTSIDSYLAYSLADGSIIAFSNEAKTGDNKGCELELGKRMDSSWINSHTNCMGFIDVNGATLPNKEVSCTSGSTSTSVETPCAVKNDAKHMTDVFPIVFHDATVEPASNAAKYVLTTSK